jgi:hypothetical protein
VIEFRPTVKLRNGLLIVYLTINSPSVIETPFECVIDETDFGDSVGVEVLDLRAQLGTGSLPQSPSTGLPTWSYDEEIDALYLRLHAANGQQQRSGTGLAKVSDLGLISQLQVSLVGGSPK